MTTIEAAAVLGVARRCELRDNAFGDAEVTWVLQDDTVLATGYFSGEAEEVNIDGYLFLGEAARALRECGTLETERNDSAGPDEYTEGKIMPGLTREGVWKEITGAEDKK